MTSEPLHPHAAPLCYKNRARGVRFDSQRLKAYAIVQQGHLIRSVAIFLRIFRHLQVYTCQLLSALTALIGFRD